MKKKQKFFLSMIIAKMTLEISISILLGMELNQLDSDSFCFDEEHFKEDSSLYHLFSHLVE
jgi:hypothetical protein